MPIKIPNELPAAKVLTDENIFIMTETRAITQDIRALKILLLNLMPTKIDTETQLSRLLGNTALQIELELIHTRSHESKNTPEDHLLAFYKTFDEVKEQNWDGLIITGAPIEQMEFEEVEYWDELVEIMLEVAMNRSPTIRIGRDAGYPTSYVQERFSKITAMHIERVMEGIADNRTQVRNTRAYLLASLFNSVSTLDNQCTMQYNYNLGGSW